VRTINPTPRSNIIMSDTVFEPEIRQQDGIEVRRAQGSDVAGLAALFGEMQLHYSRPVAPSLAMEAAVLACRPAFAVFDPRALVAVADGVIVGSAVLNVTFPASELSRSLYIRDLYVTASMRRRGVGRALVKAAISLTMEEGFSALDWTTDTANLDARKMYESCGARLMHRSYYRLTKEDLEPAN